MYPLIKLIKVLILISLILFLSIDIPSAKVHNDKTIKSKINSYDNKSFNLSSEKLPKNYLGHDIKKVFAALSKRRLSTKDEFETTDEYQERIKRELKKTIYGSLTIDNIYAFKSMASIDTNYDADKEILHATIKPDPIFNPDNLRDERLAFLILIDYQSKGSYVARILLEHEDR